MTADPAKTDEAAASLKNMAAIATITNPLNTNNVLMWWNGSDGGLKVNQRAFSDKQPRGYVKPAGTAQIKNPSSIATFRCNDLLYSYAIGATDTAIYSFSPTVEKVGADISNLPTLSSDALSKGALAGTSNGTKGWLYYLDSSNKLQEYAIGEGPTGRLSSITPRLDSYLTAFYDTGNKSRWLAYQDATRLNIVAPLKGNPIGIPGSENATAGTPIAACFANNTYYVYWVQNNLLYRNSMPNTPGGSFEASAKLYDKAPKVLDFSQMSVTPAGQDLNVYYLGSVGNEPKFVQFVDKMTGTQDEDE